MVTLGCGQCTGGLKLPLPGYTLATPHAGQQRVGKKSSSSQPSCFACPCAHSPSHIPSPPPHTTFSRVYILDLKAPVQHPCPITAAKKASRTPSPPSVDSSPHSNQSPSTSKPVFVGALSHHPTRPPKSPHTHTGSPYRVFNAGWVWRRARDAGLVRLEGWKEGERKGGWARREEKEYEIGFACLILGTSSTRCTK